ncbi:MAG: hypothetical protein ACKV2T_12520 [Kofleriaceae bacterium]
MSAKKSPARKPAKPEKSARKPATKKPVATKTASKPATSKPTASKPTASKPAAKKTASKPAGKKTASKPAAKSRTSSLADRLAAVAIPSDAWALSRVKPGVSVSPHVDRLLAIGWPHMISVVDEPWTPTNAKQALRTYDLSRVVPRDMLPRLYAYKSVYDPSQRDAAFAAEPMDVTLASVIYDETTAHTWERIWILEAMFGAEPVATEFVDALVKAPSHEWEDSVVSAAAIKGLGSVLDRASAVVRAQLRGKLEELYAGLGDNAPTGAGKALDIILHGRKGVARSGRLEPDNSDFHWARDDAKWVEKEVLAKAPTWKGRDRNWFDAQLAFVGGPKVLAAMRASLASGGVYSEHVKAVGDQLSLFV